MQYRIPRKKTKCEKVNATFEKIISGRTTGVIHTTKQDSTGLLMYRKLFKIELHDNAESSSLCKMAGKSGNSMQLCNFGQ